MKKKQPMEEKQKEEATEQKQEETQPETPVTEDRSAYNCPDCNGEGLTSLGKICQTCKGTGKV